MDLEREEPSGAPDLRKGKKPLAKALEGVRVDVDDVVGAPAGLETQEGGAGGREGDDFSRIDGLDADRRPGADDEERLVSVAVDELIEGENPFGKLPDFLNGLERANLVRPAEGVEIEVRQAGRVFVSFQKIGREGLDAGAVACEDAFEIFEQSRLDVLDGDMEELGRAGGVDDHFARQRAVVAAKPDHDPVVGTHRPGRIGDQKGAQRPCSPLAPFRSK
ncbi:MAG: hypothetical protein A3I06_05990 [Candidatus Lindowbacteria bacterium RIFCSPLOWO2_02_FULL_62_12]|nr:MAG: hypothetical protein A3I06_05990 [Candidatus Lindowbacteria bacterium RIFCSPLOWO2_02_FULL_62_12]